MTLAEKLKNLLGREYNDMDPELLDMQIRELSAADISPKFNASYTVDPLHNVFTRETIGVMICKTPARDYDIISIKFEEDIEE